MAGGFDGARIAGPIWVSFMKAVIRRRPDLLEGNFAHPSNVKLLRTDPNRGCVTNGLGIDEFFIQGREPSVCS